ncbi:TPA: hypothetical protein ACRZ6V_001249 [Vibrio harveyi]
MQVNVVGFETIIGTNFNAQLPHELEVINPDSASIVDGKQAGKAIRLTNKAYLKFRAENAYGGYALYVGFAFKVQDVTTPQELAQIAYSESYLGPLSVSSAHQKNNPLIYIKDGALWLKDENEDALLRTIQPDTYYYLELRHQYYYRLLPNSAQSEIWLNGAIAKKIWLTSSGNGNCRPFIHIGNNSNAASVLDIDDLYIVYLGSTSGVGHEYTNKIMPILASGKVKAIDLMNTKSNSFDVVGAVTADAALSDLNDDSYISSSNAAETIVGLDTNVRDAFSAALTVRASTETDGALSVAILDSRGNAISGTTKNVGLEAEVKTYHLLLASNASEATALAAKIKAGSTLKVSA